MLFQQQIVISIDINLLAWHLLATDTRESQMKTMYIVFEIKSYYKLLSMIPFRWIIQHQVNPVASPT